MKLNYSMLDVFTWLEKAAAKKAKKKAAAKKATKKAPAKKAAKKPLSAKKQQEYDEYFSKPARVLRPVTGEKGTLPERISVSGYIRQLNQTLGEPGHEAVLARLEADKLLTIEDLVKISQAHIHVGTKSMSRKKLLAAIRSRHERLLDSRRASASIGGKPSDVKPAVTKEAPLVEPKPTKLTKTQAAKFMKIIKSMDERGDFGLGLELLEKEGSKENHKAFLEFYQALQKEGLVKKSTKKTSSKAGTASSADSMKKVSAFATDMIRAMDSVESTKAISLLCKKASTKTASTFLTPLELNQVAGHLGIKGFKSYIGKRPPAPKDRREVRSAFIQAAKQMAKSRLS